MWRKSIWELGQGLCLCYWWHFYSPKVRSEQHHQVSAGYCMAESGAITVTCFSYFEICCVIQSYVKYLVINNFCD